MPMAAEFLVHTLPPSRNCSAHRRRASSVYARRRHRRQRRPGVELRVHCINPYGFNALKYLSDAYLLQAHASYEFTRW